MHYLGNNFVLMVQEAHKQGYLIDSPLHADIAATLNQHNEFALRFRQPHQPHFG